MISAWYLRRLTAMTPLEMAWRARDLLRQAYWERRYFAAGTAPGRREIRGATRFVGGIDRGRAREAPEEPRTRALAAADALLSGAWNVFRVCRCDVAANPDWHRDVNFGVGVPSDSYTFRIRTHGEALGFDTKYVWELSRHHHTTLLAMAYWLTGKDVYARRAADTLASWREANPFLHGIHWASSIEVGMRLIAFTWIRRLLEDWPDTATIFDGNPAFRQLIYEHQWLLARRMSMGSSANNHLIYEACGLFVSASAMPWFTQSRRWRGAARKLLEHEFPRQTFRSGYNRELASAYNGFVLEAMLIALAEISLGAAEPSSVISGIAVAALQKLADLADCNGHPPRQGDADDAHGLLLDAPDYDRWTDLLNVGAAWFSISTSGATQSLRSWLLGGLIAPHADRAPTPREPAARDAGLLILRQDCGTPNEISCAFDCGPLGYLSIAAHGHADALAIELRCGGHPILVDVGTYNYTAAPAWRDYFRATAAHNTVELGETSQSVSGGPFLWLKHAKCRLIKAEGLTGEAEPAVAIGEHDGYTWRPFAGRHRRTVVLRRTQRRLEIVDDVSARSRTPCRLLFHLHPAISCRLETNLAHLQWKTGSATMTLSPELQWRAVRGSEDPVLGWYSSSYDMKEPATTLVGEGTINGALAFATCIDLPLAG